MLKRKELVRKRANRIRKKLKSFSQGKFRLTVFRSNSNIYAQVIDDAKGITIVSASTLDKQLLSETKEDRLELMGKISLARKVGLLVAFRASKAGVSSVVFDKGGYLYHGRVKALAEAAREGGLKF